MDDFKPSIVGKVKKGSSRLHHVRVNIHQSQFLDGEEGKQQPGQVAIASAQNRYTPGMPGE